MTKGGLGGVLQGQRLPLPVGVSKIDSMLSDPQWAARPSSHGAWFDDIRYPRTHDNGDSHFYLVENS